MTDDRSPSPPADVVDFAAFRARRLGEQPTLCDPPVASREAWPAPGRASIGPCAEKRLMTRRAVEHRERMLRHLRGVQLEGLKA